MDSLKVIKNAAEHGAALAELESLLDSSPAAGSSEANRLEVLSVLLQEYESKHFPFELPDPIEAIVFRMEQQSLSPRDLIPMIGSRSKVSEILSKKRPLTLAMVRALHEGLGIPARVLIQEVTELDLGGTETKWENFPAKEMIARGWIKTIHDVQSFFEELSPKLSPAVLFKQSEHVRSARSMDPYAILAWTARVAMKGRGMKKLGKFTPESFTVKDLKQLAKESSRDHGPQRAISFLAEVGIPLVIEPHLPHTYIDGAALLMISQMPIVGLTLRYDRLDNFWFTLMHELAHVILHSGFQDDFIDDLDYDSADPIEKEADEMAGEVLIPLENWKRSPASRLRSPEAMRHLAKELKIHEAIVAGKIRHFWNSYRVLNQFVGHGLVRTEFPEINWPE